MIIGFGTTEIETAKQIINECVEAVAALPDKDHPELALQNVKDKYDKIDKVNSALSRPEAPERYSYFWFDLYNKTPHYFGYTVKFTFHHINRQHALSDDGWALLRTNWMLDVSYENKDENKDEDEVQIFRET